MRGRLFWKTAIGFWATYALITQCVTLIFAALHYQPSLTDEQVARRVGPMVLELCANAVERFGPPSCAEVLRRHAPTEMARVQVVAAASRSADDDGGVAHLRIDARGPDGRAYAVLYRYTPSPPWPPWILHMPVEVLLLGALGGLTFSAALAWYVIAPIRRVRRGFEQLAQGDLTVRVGHAVGGRRDELADLARDFDWMASRVGELVGARDRLLHDVSHELRSPLSRLQLSVALARKDAGRLPQSLDRIEREVLRLDELVNELLTLARAESNVAASEEYFDLVGLLRSVLADARFEAAASHVVVAARLPRSADGLPPLRGSSELIRRAIENVLRNALKYSPSGGRVQVSLSFDAAASRYQIAISDEGAGVPDADIERLFEPFTKAGDAREGFGLGLSIAQRALRVHGGAIQACNRSPHGLAVTMVLPADTSLAPAVLEAEHDGVS